MRQGRLSCDGTVGEAFAHGRAVDLAGWQPASAVDLFAGTSVNTIVLEIPDAELGSGRDIGVWAVTMLATDAGGWHPINRAGRPMIQPIFHPAEVSWWPRRAAGQRTQYR